uniref:Uncharacterized protein n=1 Tax=Romanomermis culicivorax TaxID=13658 RepID=A0A915I5Q3_ROMCU
TRFLRGFSFVVNDTNVNVIVKEGSSKYTKYHDFVEDAGGVMVDSCIISRSTITSLSSTSTNGIMGGGLMNNSVTFLSGVAGAEESINCESDKFDAMNWLTDTCSHIGSRVDSWSLNSSDRA